jgi:peptide/nickel transport system permease protein
VIRYIAGRLLQAIAVILAVATVSFVLLHLAPGDPFSGASESTYSRAEDIARLKREFGLDQPIVVQYARYLGNLARGNFGPSFAQHRPAWDVIRETVPNTLGLAFTALIIDFVIGIAAGALQGARAGTRLDRALNAATLLLFSVPVFWIGLILQVWVAQRIGLPVTGIRDISHDYYPPVQQAWDTLRHLLLPAFTLGLIGAASTARFQRAQLLEVIHQDYIRTARAKGLAERVVLWRHAARNALLPTIALFGLSLPALLSGAVLVESMFSWPGMGRLTTDAIATRDYYVVTGIAIFAATLVVTGNFLAEVLGRLVDPRTRALR